MGAIYYNAIVVKADGIRVKYRDITRLPSFLDFALQNLSPDCIFIYRKQSRYHSQGSPAGYWNRNKGLVMY